MDQTESLTEAAQLRARGQLTVPTAIRDALHAREGDYLEFTVTEHGEVTVRATRRIAADQAWFWTPEWQAGEAAASADLAAGRTAIYDSAEDFIDALRGAGSTGARKPRRRGRTDADV